MKSWGRLRKKGIFPYGAGLLLASLLLLALQWKLDFHWGAPADATTLNRQDAASAPPSREPQSAFAPPSGQLSLAQQLEMEARNIGSVTNDPDFIDVHLDDWAKRLRKADLLELRDVIFQGTASGDEVALALDLLGRSDETLAQQVLLDYLLMTPPNGPEQETFQMLALDGLLSQSERSKDPSALQRIVKESTDPFLVRRAQQALGALDGNHPWPHETDEKALQDLLEKSAL